MKMESRLKMPKKSKQKEKGNVYYIFVERPTDLFNRSMHQSLNLDFYIGKRFSIFVDFEIVSSDDIDQQPLKKSNQSMI